MTVTRARLEIQANQKWENLATRTVVNETRRGRTNNGAEITLTNGATSTTVTDDLVTTNSVIHITPETANARGANVYIPRNTITQGQYVVQHASLSTTDCTFMVTVNC